MGNIRLCLISLENTSGQLNNMKKIIYTLLFLTGIIARAESLVSKELNGTWKFASYRFQGTERPRPNPNLNLVFEFYSDGMNRLYWTRSDQQGICERIAYYQVSSSENTNTLWQKVTWVNPQNRIECAQDPDMKLGQSSATNFNIIDGKLETDIQMGDDIVQYIWEKQ